MMEEFTSYLTHISIIFPITPRIVSNDYVRWKSLEMYMAMLNSSPQTDTFFRLDVFNMHFRLIYIHPFTLVKQHGLVLRNMVNVVT